MFQDFMMWIQESGKWNDGVLLCTILAIACLAFMAFSNKE